LVQPVKRMPIHALPSGDAGCSGRPPAADGESFILPPPLAGRSKTRHRNARNGVGREGAPKQGALCLHQITRPRKHHVHGHHRFLLRRTRRTSRFAQPAGRLYLIFFPTRELKFTLRQEIVDPGTPNRNSGKLQSLRGEGGNAQRRRPRL
jgi:hypothetical protein